MGREIVYCETCGTGLREADFAKGKACKVDNRPFCTKCAPVQAAASSANRPEGTPRSPARKISSTSVPAQPGTPRRSVPTVAKGPNPMVLAGAVAGGIALLVLLVVAASGRPKPTPPPPPAPPPKTSHKAEAPPPPPERRVAEEPVPRRPLAVQREPETLKEPTEQEKNAKLDAFLAQIRTMIAADKDFEKRVEIGGMIAAAEKSAGARLADVRAVRELHEKGFDDAAKAACDAARAEAERLWAEKRFPQAVDRARLFPEIFKGTRRAEELLKFADDLEKRSSGAAEKERAAALEAWKPWKIESSAEEGLPKILPAHAGRENVLQTHPLARDKAAGLERAFDLPAGKKSTLSLWVAPHAQGDWELRVLADGKLLHKQAVSPPNSGWKPVTVDLTPLAGKKTLLRLENAPTEWAWEYAYWSDIEVKSE